MPRRAVLGLSAVAALLTMALSAAPAGAATTDDAQIALTGLVDAAHPAGGSQLGVHPGDSVRLTASALPTAQVKGVAGGLGSVGGQLDGLLGNATFRVTANFSGLPGGHPNTVLSGSQAVTFRFAGAGTYHFSWTADSISTSLLGTYTQAVQLSGNDAKRAGVALNAQNGYVGTIVVTKNPPAGGISVQIPTITVQPRIAVVQLPKVTVPRLSPPTIPVPKLAPPVIPGSITPALTPPAKTTKPSRSTRTVATGTDGQLPVPARVVPGAGTGVDPVGNSAGNSAGGSGGFGALNGGPVGDYIPMTTQGDAATAGPDARTGGTARGHADPVNAAPIDLAAAPDTSSSQLPILLAIAAIIALSLVAATYARLFLLRRRG